MANDYSLVKLIHVACGIVKAFVSFAQLQVLSIKFKFQDLMRLMRKNYFHRKKARQMLIKENGCHGKKW